MEGTFLSHPVRKTRQERAQSGQVGAAPGRSILLQEQDKGERGGGRWRGSCRTRGHLPNRQRGRGGLVLESEDLKTSLALGLFLWGTKRSGGCLCHPPSKTSPPLHWAALTLQRTAVTVFVCVCVCASVLPAAGPHGPREQQKLRACLRWHHLQDEVQNSRRKCRC